ncbi:MAG: aminotransferase class III [Bacteroidetes bacterium]|nr:MAG: aminotransferase class III [Bacteroidota bacterium]
MNPISELLKSQFNINNAQISKLNGYANINYLVQDAQRKYVLKEYRYEPRLLEFINAENKLLDTLSEQLPGYFQTPVKANNNTFIVEGLQEGKIYRLLYYIEGALFAETKHSKELFESFGAILAKMDKTLQKLHSPAIEARRYEWDILQIDYVKKFFKDIPDPADRKLVEYFYQQYNEVVRPKIPELRHCIIHNDTNDYNVLVAGDKISGIIDFGDTVYSLLINELAVAITYAIFGKDDPIGWAKPIIKGYSKTLPLEEKEIDLLYYLIAARLCLSLSKSAHEKLSKPKDNYITVSEAPAWNLLKKWLSINPIKAADEFRKAANLSGIIKDPNNEDIEKRWNHLSKVFSLSYPKPIKMEKAAFQYMYDNQGNTFLDTRNNIPHVGHNHPRVVAAGQRKMAQLNTNTRYLYDEITEYSEKLLAKFPKQLKKVFFVNSGSAASDLAIRLALTHTQKPKIAVMEYGYHGNTQVSINISHYKFAGKGGKGTPDNILVNTVPDTLRGKYTDEQTAGKQYADDFIKSAEHNTGMIAAFITEPIVSAAGQVPMPKNYLNEVYDFIRSQGGVCISDEVQTGFGRIGTHFWAYQSYDVVPDIVVLGKPIGNGHPLAAVVCTDEIANSFNNGMEFFSSFGGNPVSCAIGNEVLKVIEDEKLMQNALEVGNYMIEGFKNLQKKYNCIAAIRGSGLSLGIDFVKKQKTKEHDTRLANKIVNELKINNILIGTDGPFDNVLKIKPPLCFTKKNTDELLGEIEKVLKDQSETIL